MITGTILDAHEVSCGSDIEWVGFLLFVVGTYLFWRVCEQKKRMVICRSGWTLLTTGLIGVFFHIPVALFLLLLGVAAVFLEWLTRPIVITLHFNNK